MNSEEFITLSAVGDISFSGDIQPEFLGHENKALKAINQILIESDLNFCNLEGPITKSNNKQNRHYSKILNSDSSVHLKSDPIFGKILKNYNFNIVSIANNHILDYNEEGLFDTIEFLNNINIHFVGAGSNLNEARKAYFFEKNGIKVGFLAYSYTYEATNRSAGTAPLWKDIILKDLDGIRNKVDHIIVSLHFGTEFSNISSLPEKRLAYLLVDNGVSLVLGHHPHVLREIECYKNGIIAYSLGNFIFDISLSKIDNINLENTRQSIILKLNITKTKIIVDKVYPIYLSEKGIPNIAPKEKQSSIFGKINNNSVFSPKIKKVTKKNQIVIYLKKLMLSIKLICVSIKIGEFRNLYLIFKRYYNLI